MNTTQIKRFAQYARKALIEQVTVKLNEVLAVNSLARRNNSRAVLELEIQIKTTSINEVVERVAYTWFNRFCALRFMDVKGYNKIQVLSPADLGQFQPEILVEAKQGYIDGSTIPSQKYKEIFDLLESRVTSNNPQNEAYKLLIIAVSNYWYEFMPFLFEKIDDYTELLMPNDVLSGTSIIAFTREALTPANCKNVEVLGWLYQYYISEKKDEVFARMKSNRKVLSEEIPAATQLFTPNWIVRYLVDNSLGRLWLLNKPTSIIAEKMDYYIKPEHPEIDFPRISSPEELKVCDPACGSGHILVYAFDLLYMIYEEEGYDLSEIPQLILKHNLYGIEIDERAGELASLTLMMKAREKSRRFFNYKCLPSICVLENIFFEKDELDNFLKKITNSNSAKAIQMLCSQFENSKTFGSLIRPYEADIEELFFELEKQNFIGDLLFEETKRKVLLVLKQASYLQQKYHVVVANPPYMGNKKGMNESLSNMLRTNYKDAKYDLFSAFIVRNTELALPNGKLAFMTPNVWMFTASYIKLRLFLLNEKTVTSLMQLNPSGFSDATVTICAFTLENNFIKNFSGDYIRLSEFTGVEETKEKALEAIKNPYSHFRFRISSEKFMLLPDTPIVFWIAKELFNLFQSEKDFKNFGVRTVSGLQTGDNDLFIRYWFEISDNKRSNKWINYMTGGGSKKWFGNFCSVVNWENGGEQIREHKSSKISEDQYAQVSGITWNRINSTLAVRYLPENTIFDQTSDSLFTANQDSLFFLLAYLNSKVSALVKEVLCPGINTTAGSISKFPYPSKVADKEQIINNVDKLISLAKADWDSREISWDFKKSPFLEYDNKKTLKEIYATIRNSCEAKLTEAHQCEEENNSIFIKTYSFENELSAKVALSDISLESNPSYRYKSVQSNIEREKLMLADTIRELISYAVGCMFGRYSIDKAGLILSNQDEDVGEYLQQIPAPSFMPDKDNIIPILSDSWFTDDIVARFSNFIKTAFGEINYQENINFIEQALNSENKISYTIRDYFTKEFYSDHVKHYQKRPIYWLFSSPKGSFNVLIYLHRYTKDTINTILNEYLRVFIAKLEANKKQAEAELHSVNISTSEKAKLTKRINALINTLAELEDYEREILYPLAIERIEIDLDQGVKVNYVKFDKALKKIF